MRYYRTASLIFSLVSTLDFMRVVWSAITKEHHARLVVFDTNNKRYELNGRECHGGVYFPEPRKFKCVCVRGVWGVYGKYCEAPISIVGGDNECFKIPSDTIPPISQFIIFGNPKYPFEPILTHFRQDYTIFTKFYAVEKRELDLDASSPFLSITNHFWELESDNGELICLAGEKKRKNQKQFCYFHNHDWVQGQVQPWNLIVGIRKGCHAKVAKQYSSNCVDIPSNPEFPQENGVEVCNGPEIQLFYQNGTKDDAGEQETKSPLKSAPVNPTTVEPLLDFPETTALEVVSTTEAPTTPSSTAPSTSTTEIPVTELPIPTEPEVNLCVEGIERESVRQYWGGEGRDCPTSATEAVFLDQLKRIAAKKMNKIFEARIKSLEQVTELIRMIFQLMRKTCPEEAVSNVFLTDATEAFTMFINEDFFYGVEELESDVFNRFKESLQNCINRATMFNLSMVERECENTEVTGTLTTADGQSQVIEIPASASSKNFEPLIEAVWKMFLNAHAYCYEDFEQINDHHHFSTLFFSIFSETIYEKWTSRIAFDLYRFVIPEAKNLGLTMKNLDYCVGATNLISQCQTWLQRSSSPEKEEKRSRRSTWEADIKKVREETKIWNDLGGHCLQSPEEPAFKLGYGKCLFPA